MDSDVLKTQKELVEAKVEANKRHIARKKAEPSVAVTLESLHEILDEIVASVTAANEKIAEHNKTVENISSERAALTKKVWRFVVDDIKSSYDTYEQDKGNLDTAIQSIEAQIERKGKEKEGTNSELQTLEQSVTSIKPTVDSINKILLSFGFTGFALSVSEKTGYYQILRPNGIDAKETLSEGERTFLTFLYFYHLLRGSTSESGVTSNRVVVFDDPISSLDSDILFIVSSLIKGLMQDVRNGQSQIKQIFLLTHNIYFHREITFDKRRSADQARNYETFWIIKKGATSSEIERQETNPIKTSYELLWQEVRNPNPSPLTIQNTLRRILENYFKILGNIDSDNIINLFEGEEKIICGSLFSWVNAGSHYATDDLYVTCDQESVAKYLDVFKKIFDKSKHTAHYEMMIGTQDAA